MFRPVGGAVLTAGASVRLLEPVTGPTQTGASGIRWRIGFAFFLQAAVLGLWVVNFPLVLKARGLAWLVAYVGAIGGASSLFAPAFGSLADNRVSAEKVYRILSLLAAVVLAAFFFCLQSGVPWQLCMLVYAAFWLLYTPTWSLLAAIAFANLPDKEGDFPKVRAMGTIGWMVAGVLVSFVLKSDESCLSGYVASGVLVFLGVFAGWLPKTPPGGAAPSSIRRMLGLEALSLFSDRDQRVFFITTGLIALPIAAFYPYTPRLLEWLGTKEVAGVMALSQLTEVIAMFTLVGLMKRWRVKSLISIALGAALLRYLLYLLGVGTQWVPWVILGLMLHGIAYTFHMVTGQVFLDRRVDKAMRGQAQALLSSIAGVGSVFGALIVGQWFLLTVEHREAPLWSPFWGGLTVIIFAVMAYFILCYRGDRK